MVFLLVWETMLGRHVKPGNGRKRKRAVWPPLPHRLGDTGKQETGREGGKEGGGNMEGQYGGKGGHYEGEETDVRQRRLGKCLTHHKVAAEVVLSPLLVPLAHGLHPLDKLSQDAGLVHLPVL